MNIIGFLLPEIEGHVKKILSGLAQRHEWKYAFHEIPHSSSELHNFKKTLILNICEQIRCQLAELTERANRSGITAESNSIFAFRS
jgi:hypothetical protein